MAGGKISPRQKMINMMYLVLTALLALNVSKEVLNSFFEVNKGITRTTVNFNAKKIQTLTLLLMLPLRSIQSKQVLLENRLIVLKMKRISWLFSCRK
jgi:hypothetical protein